jgi:hypothetical protein
MLGFCDRFGQKPVAFAHARGNSSAHAGPSVEVRLIPRDYSSAGDQLKFKELGGFPQLPSCLWPTAGSRVVRCELLRH